MPSTDRRSAPADPFRRSPHADVVARVPVRAGELALRSGPTRYWRYGEQHGAPSLVFVHGLRGSHEGLEPIAAHLARLAPVASVVVPDLPGFATSPPFNGAAHDVAGYAAWTTELLGALAPDGSAVLAGHSFGSIVAAAALGGAAGSAAARGLVLVNPITAARIGPAVGFAIGYHRLAAALPERAGTVLLRNPVLTRVASSAMVRSADRGLVRWIHAEHGRHFGRFAERRVVLEAFGASVAEHVDRYAPLVGGPVLLVAGELDGIAPLPTQRVLVGRFADARLSVIASTGHLTHYETPAEVADAIAAFVAGLPPR